jgi:hypothetical protein
MESADNLLWKLFCVTDYRYELCWHKTQPIYCPKNQTHLIQTPILCDYAEPVQKIMIPMGVDRTIDEKRQLKMTPARIEKLLCKICKFNIHQCAVVDCGHKYMCISCAQTSLKRDIPMCYICSTPIKIGIIKIWDG